MKRTVLLSLWLVYFLPVLGQTDFTAIESNIEHVTVYMQGAQIKRTVPLTLPPGRHEITLTKLSPHIDANSFRLTLPNVMIQSVQFNPIVKYSELPESRLKEVRDSIHLFALKQEDLQTERRIHESEKEFIRHNRSIIGQDGINAENFRQTILLISERTDYLERSLANINRSLRQITEHVQRLSAERTRLSTLSGTRIGEVTVVVIANARVSTTMSLSYFVSEASWFPSYEANVKNLNTPLQLTYRAHIRQSTGVDWKNVKISVSNTNPTLETSVPLFEPQIIGRSRGTQASSRDIARRTRKISGRVVDAQTGEEVMFANVMVHGYSYGVQTDFDGNFSILVNPEATHLEVSFVGYNTNIIQITSNHLTIKMHPGVSFNEVVITEYRVPLIDIDNTTTGGMVSSSDNRLNIRGSRADATENYVDGVRVRGQLVPSTTAGAAQVEIPIEINMKEMPRGFTIDIEEPYSIPSDNQARVVTLNKKSLETIYLHVTKPRQLEDVFLTAGIIDWHQHNLLPGEILLIFEDTYVGKSLLEPSISSDTLRISLGKDDAIMVKRTDVSRKSDKRIWRNRYRELRTIELNVRNNRSEAVALKLTDQIPVSQLDAIKVEPIAISDAVYTENTGRLDWILNLSPGSLHLHQFSYVVEYPTATRLTWD